MAALGSSCALGGGNEPERKKGRNPAANSEISDGTVTNTPALLNISTSSSNWLAGVCQPVTIRVLAQMDSSSATVSQSVPVELVAYGADGAFFLNSNCTQTTEATVIQAGSSSTSLFYRQLSSGQVTVAAMSGSLGPAAMTVNIMSSSVAAVTVSGTTPGDAETCIPITVSTRTDTGALIATASPRVVTMSDGATGGSFYTDAACTSSTTTVSIPTAQSFQAAYYSRNYGGVVTLEGALAGATTGTFALTLNAIPPTRLAITGSGSIYTVACTAYTITAQDNGGTTRRMQVPTTVNLTGAGADGAFYDSAACDSTITSVDFSPGQQTATFYYSKPTPASVTLRASTAGLTDGTRNVNVVARPTTQLALDGPTTLLTTTCGQYTVELRDAQGNPTWATANRTVNLSAGSGTFYSDSGCATSVTSVVVTNGTQTQTFYYRKTTPGAATLTAASAGVTSANLNVTVSVDEPTQIAVTGNTPVTTLDCTPYAITFQDAMGNASAPDALHQVTLSGAGTNGGFFSGSDCTGPITTVDIDNQSPAATIYYAKTSPGVVTLAAAAAGFTSGSQVVTVNAGTASKLVLAGSASIVTTSCAAYTVSTQDALGNASAVGADLTVSLNVGSGEFYSEATCTSDLTVFTVAENTSQATFYYRKTSPGAVTLGASAGGYTGDTLNVTVSTGAPEAIRVAGNASLSVNECSPYVVTLRDAHDNATTSGDAVEIGFSGEGPGGAFYDAAGCGNSISDLQIGAGQGTVTVYYMQSSGGDAELRAASAGLTDGVIDISVSQPPPAKIVIERTVDQPTTNDCVQMRLNTLDAADQPAPVSGAFEVTLGGAGSGGKFFSDGGCTNEITKVTVLDGSSAESYFYRKATPGTVMLSAARMGLLSGTDSFTVDQGFAVQIAFTTISAMMAARSCHRMVLQAQDVHGNPAAFEDHRPFDFHDIDQGSEIYSDATCDTHHPDPSLHPGETQLEFYYRRETPGDLLVSAEPGDLSTPVIEVTVTSGIPVSLAWVSPPSQFPALTCVPLTYGFRDDSGSFAVSEGPVDIRMSGGGDGRFYSDSSCLTQEQDYHVEPGSAGGVVYFLKPSSGSVNLRVSDTAGALSPHTANLEVSSGTPQMLVYVNPAETLLPNACTAYEVELRDEANMTVVATSDVGVNLSGGGSDGRFYRDADCTLESPNTTIDRDESRATFWFWTPTPGDLTLRASGEGLSDANASVTVIELAASLTFSSGPDSISVGACEAYAVDTMGSEGNVVTVVEDTELELHDGAGGTYYADSNCTLTSDRITLHGGTSRAYFYYKATGAGARVLEVTSHPLSPATTTVTAN